MAHETRIDLNGMSDDELERYVQRTWLQLKPSRRDIGLLNHNGEWLILRVNEYLAQHERTYWRMPGDQMLVCGDFVTRFMLLCELLEMVPSAAMVSSCSWGEHE